MTALQRMEAVPFITVMTITNAEKLPGSRDSHLRLSTFIVLSTTLGNGAIVV
jgi:hypothetical protein